MDRNTCRVLVVEDNPGDVFWFENTLSNADSLQWSWSVAPSLHDALTHLDNNSVDLIVLDLGLPDSRGLETLNNIRGKAPSSPIVVCSGNDDQDFAMRVIASGAQDYLMKDSRDPAQFLRSLSFAFLRHQQKLSSTVLDLNDQARLDLVSQSLEVREDGQQDYTRKSLTPFEFKLLAYFARSTGRTLSRSEILQQLRGDEFQDYTERTIDVHISTLKHKYPFMKNLIRSVYGIGYVFGGNK